MSPSHNHTGHSSKPYPSIPTASSGFPAGLPGVCPSFVFGCEEAPGSDGMPSCLKLLSFPNPIDAGFLCVTDRGTARPGTQEALQDHPCASMLKQVTGMLLPAIESAQARGPILLQPVHPCPCSLHPGHLARLGKQVGMAGMAGIPGFACFVHAW